MKKAKKFMLMLLAVVMMAAILPVQAEAAVKLNKTTASIYVGAAVKLKVSGTKSKVKWSSSNKKIAAVNTNGKVRGKKAGTAVIAAKVSGKKYRCRITVKNPYLNKTTIKLSKGKSYTLKLTGTAAKSWKSSNKAVASVSQKGKVTGKKAGTAAVTCAGANGKSYKCKVSVKADEVSRSSGLSEAEVYAAMIALKEKYPEGTRWTNANYYAWKGGIYSGGYGCAGFAFLLSDAAFGSLQARKHNDYSNIRVGDIVRMDYDNHSVIVLEVKTDSVIVAEGNYNNSVHWGREISLSSIYKSGTYVMTRYP